MTTFIVNTKPRSNSNPSAQFSPTAAAIASHFNDVRGRSRSIGEDEQGQGVNTVERSLDPPFESSQYSSIEEAMTAIPLWQHELAASRVGRQSRASSIFSTRTRLTVQSDDARSVEIEAGGQSFRISRDGSRITNTTAPPPYPGPPLEELTEESDEEDYVTPSRHSEDTLRDYDDADDDNNKPSDNAAQLDSSSQSLPLRTHQPPGSVQLDDSPNTGRLQRLRTALQRSWYGSNEIIPSPPQTSYSSSTTLRRTQSDSSSVLRPSLLDHDDNDPLSTPTHPPPQHRPDSPTTEITQSYTHLIRDLDRSHRLALAERDTELTRLRTLLNEKDIVVRQQLRQRDHAIDELTEQLARRERELDELRVRVEGAEERLGREVERARNQVEDMWEGRWKEYEGLLRERMLGGGGGGGERRGTLQLERDREQDRLWRDRDDDEEDFT